MRESELKEPMISHLHEDMERRCIDMLIVYDGKVQRFMMDIEDLNYSELHDVICKVMKEQKLKEF